MAIGQHNTLRPDNTKNQPWGTCRKAKRRHPYTSQVSCYCKCCSSRILISKKFYHYILNIFIWLPVSYSVSWKNFVPDQLFC